VKWRTGEMVRAWSIGKMPKIVLELIQNTTTAPFHKLREEF